MPDVLDELADWLRPYQQRFLADSSRFRCVVKSRQIGMTRVMALEMVLTVSGLHPEALCHNYTIISKDEDAAKEVIQDCLDWVNALSLDPSLAPFLELKVERATKIEFKRSRHHIISQAQSKRAGVGKRGHLFLDEFAKYYEHQEAIWRYAVPSVMSNPRLRITAISTPDGSSDIFHEMCTDRQRWHEWSLHHIDIHQAIAEGMPVTVEQARSVCQTDADFSQEYECEFIVPGHQYISRALFDSMRAKPISKWDRRVAGLDVASIVDLSAMTVLDTKDGLGYLQHALIVQSVPYGTDPVKRIVGQDLIWDAVCRYFGIELVVFDSSHADAGRLLGGMLALKPKTRIVAVSYSRQWKLDYVPRVRNAMERGRLKDTTKAVYKYSAGAGAPFVEWYTDEQDNPAGRIVDVVGFVEQAFGEHTVPLLRKDFMKVHRKLTVKGPTFDTYRDGQSHGDLFWSSTQAFAAAMMPVAAPVELSDEQWEAERLPEHLDYL